MEIRFTEAYEYLGVPKKMLENLVKAGEIACTKAGRYRVISTEVLDSWRESRKLRLIQFNEEDYRQCLDFAITSYYGGLAMTNFGTQTQREAGQFLFNSIQGKLGEIAVERLFGNYGIGIELDFRMRNGTVVGQDITEVRRGRVVNPPRIRVGIKSTKERNMCLLVPQPEVEQVERSSDIYILVRVALPLDHFLRFVKEYDRLMDIRDKIPDFVPLTAEIAGYVDKNELEGPAVSVLGNNLQKPNYFALTGSLRKSDSEWRELIGRL